MPDDRDRYYQLRAMDMQRRADLLRKGLELIHETLTQGKNDAPYQTLGEIRMLLVVDFFLHPAEEV